VVADVMVRLRRVERSVIWGTKAGRGCMRRACVVSP
jgi:hypothetical protein